MKSKGMWRLVYLAIPLTAAVFAGIMAKNSADARPDMACPVTVSCATEAVDVQRFERVPEAELDMACPVLEIYTEGNGPAPEWWMPDEPMAAVWTADECCNKLATNLQPDTVDYNAQRDIGCPDWDVDSTVCGWDGRTMEAWEMDLFSRIVFLEFGISSQECREAGIDAILRLWESEYYSSTLFGTVSAVAENGKPAFSTYPGVWEEEYDYEKLAQIRQDCEERFVNGPEWIAPFFRTGHYHDWAVPCYEIDGVYFSTGKWWQ